jgi:pyrroline-5-carboxylate reductase
MLRANLDPDILIKRVSSKGGTTEAGMKVLEEKGKTGAALSEAIRAACLRAGELANRAKS